MSQEHLNESGSGDDVELLQPKIEDTPQNTPKTKHVALQVDDNDISKESEVEEELGKYIKLRNSAADTFTPFRIKTLSKPGRKNMGHYGLIAIIILLIIIGLDIYALIASGEKNAVVIVNLMIPIIISFLSIFKIIAAVLHFLLKQFK